jgi:starch-binding outer membrane protein, SusD/RagB family
MLVSNQLKIMKKNIIKNILKLIKQHIMICIFMVAILLSACNILDKEPLDAIPETDVWNNEGLATLYLNNLYNLTMPGFSGTTNANLSDETSGGNTYMYGQLTNESVGDFSNDTYSKIRRINILLEKISTGTLTKDVVQKIKGQALFLRAWVYWNLVKLYGGVPMIMNVQNMATTGELTEELLVRRNKTRECIELIAADLDSAFRYLPTKWDDTNYGRITRGAAIALKGRVLLFWASPQFNPENKTERWQWAYDVNKMALDSLTKDGFGLHTSFKELFTDCREKTKEAIFVRVYNANIAGTYYHSYENSVRPIYLGKSGGGSNNPTWELVKAFPMIDGYPIDSATTTYSYNQNRFWVNRDPRLDITIAYNGSTWPLSGNTSRLWIYYYMNNGQSVSVESNEKRATTYTSTGFYCRKYVNPNTPRDLVDQVGTDWTEIRFAEVLLNFAECANELDGKASEARSALNRIRNERTDVKVGMAYIDAHIDNRILMREIIMNERQVELAFENKRHWDLRRRNMFQYDLGPRIKRLNGTQRTGWRIELNESPLRTPAYMVTVREGLDLGIPIVYNTYFLPGYSIILDTQYPINYPQPQYNFYAIPQTNLDKNPLLEQTNYWGGTFDPLEE